MKREQGTLGVHNFLKTKMTKTRENYGNCVGGTCLLSGGDFVCIDFSKKHSFSKDL